jgi:autotransporter passenger strand-loop-strand repeat protein
MSFTAAVYSSVIGETVSDVDKVQVVFRGGIASSGTIVDSGEQIISSGGSAAIMDRIIWARMILTK